MKIFEKKWVPNESLFYHCYIFAGSSLAQEDGVIGSVDTDTLDADLGASREGSRTGE